jgi:hypothetical protein
LAENEDYGLGGGLVGFLWEGKLGEVGFGVKGHEGLGFCVGNQGVDGLEGDVAE